MYRTSLAALFLAPILLAQGSRYEDPEGRFSLLPPKGWTCEKQEEGNAVFTDPSGRITLGIAPLVLTEPGTLDEACSGFEQLLRSRPGLSVEADGNEDLVIAGTPAKRVTYELGAGGAVMRMEATFVLLPDLLISLTANGPAASFAEHEKAVHDAIASLRLANAKGERRPGPDAARRLEALEKARDAGVLDEAEYRAKRAAIEAEMKAAREPGADSEVAAKLEALELARATGVLSDEEFERKKAELAGASGQKASKPAAAGGLPRTARKGKLYRHAVGFWFWYPGDWSVAPQEDFLQLVPPDPAGGKESPNEIYLLIGDSVEGEGISSATAPQVAEYLDQQVLSISQVLKRHGQVQTVPMARGSGARYEWRGQLPGQPEVTARAFACIIDGYGMALLGFGFPKDLDRRENELLRMFGSFGFGEGKRDPALVGDWTLSDVRSLSSSGDLGTTQTRGSYVKETKSRISIRADGTWRRIDSHEAILYGGGVSLEDSGQTESAGTWNAAEGGLFLIWTDKSWEDYRYELKRAASGPQLWLKSGDTVQVWVRG
ncbi:MAG: hypothetical protein Fur0037_18600 [Planctomycetota bacterium]